MTRGNRDDRQPNAKALGGHDREHENAEVAGHLALAYAALARKRAAAAQSEAEPCA